MRVLHVTVQHEPIDDVDCWWAESQDMPGWTASAESERELTQVVSEAVDFLELGPATVSYTSGNETEL